MAKAKVVPSWVTKRVAGAKFELIRLAKDQHAFPHEHPQHAVIKILEPVTVYKWIWTLSKYAERYSGCRQQRRTIAPLLLPRGATVIVHASAGMSKCRTDEAKYIGVKPGWSSFHASFKYTPGRYVRARLSPPTNNCGSGIHFCFRKGQVSQY